MKQEFLKITSIRTLKLALCFLCFTLSFTSLLVGLRLVTLEQRLDGLRQGICLTKADDRRDTTASHYRTKADDSLDTTASHDRTKADDRRDTAASHYRTKADDHLDEAARLQQQIAKKILRLHVIANSDTKADQQLKLKVRDAIIRHLQTRLSGINSAKAARRIVLSELDRIQAAAEETVHAEGCSDPIQVSLKKQSFPVKVYGDLSFPAGRYEALCIEIGKAKGHNWWCVLYPSLCFIDETYAIVPKESKKKLKHSLTREEYDSLEIHSALADYIRKYTKKNK